MSVVKTRAVQVSLVACTLAGSWYGMMAVHELGHVLGAFATGGRVERVVLELASFSRTDVAPNPHPLVVAWLGPVIGVLVPCLCWAIAAGVRWRHAALVRFWAGFCLLANGLYIGVGSFGRVGDAGDLIAYGSPGWTLWVFGLVAVCGGLAAWNGTGRYFGTGRDTMVPAGALHVAVAAALFWLAVVLVV